MHKFTYDFLKKNTITSDLFSLANIIVDLKVKTDDKKSSNKSLFSKLETIAIRESVKGSNAIEGIITTEKRIKEIIENSSEPLSLNEEEIAGYHDAIKYITKNFQYLDFDEDTIKMIHSMLVDRHVGYDKGGKYKKSDNVIAEKYSDGRIKRVVFVPVKAKDVDKSMKELVLA